jgi:hypothetical protein
MMTFRLGKRPRPFKLTAPRSYPELELHKAVAGALDWLLLRPAFYTTFPSGWDKMTKAMRGMLKGAGLKPGMPDILVFFAGRCVGIELKAGSGLSAAQRGTHSDLHAAGIPVHVCRSVDDVLQALSGEGIPIRADRSHVSYANAPLNL